MNNDSDNLPGVTTPMIDAKAIGIEASWAFGFGDADAVIMSRQLVRDILDNHGIGDTDELIPSFGSDDALKRALRYAPKKKAMTVKEFARPNKGTPRAVGVYIRVGRDGEAGDGWQCAARVRWDGDTSTIVCLPPEGETQYPSTDAWKVAKDMADMANMTMMNVMNVDLSTALTSIGYRFGWISRRRNSGGVYFLPTDTDTGRDNAERFASILRALAAYTDGAPRESQFIPQVHELFPSPMTMQSWQGSAQDAFAADVEKLQKELDRMASDGKMRDTTKQERAAQADEIIAKAKSYRKFLGDSVEAISTQLATIQKAFIDAIGANLDDAAAALDAVDAVAEATVAAPIPIIPEPAPAPRQGRHVVISDDDLFVA
ncbi:MAG: hypothetical protein ACTSXZ_06205 [Alphaproteobacteria bacterium]